MWNPIKWQLRPLEAPCTPRGPAFSKAAPVNFSVGGSKIQLRLNRPSGGLNKNYTDVGGDHPLDNAEAFDPAIYTPSGPIDLEKQVLLYYSWAYFGPPFTGFVAELGCAISLVSGVRASDQHSLFCPENFEHHIEWWLRNAFGNPEEFNCGHPRWSTPNNWRLLDLGDLTGVLLDAVTCRGAGERKRYLVFPVAHDKYIEIGFRLKQYEPGSIEELDAIIDPSSMIGMVDNVVKSVEVALSDLAKSQLADAQNKYLGKKLTAYKRPLRFTTAEDDVRWAEYQALQKEAKQNSSPFAWV